jgi:hypothetical protein
VYKNEEFQARMISESLATINNAIPHLPCDKTLVIEYAALVGHAADFIAPMSTLLGVKSATLAGAFSHLAPREKKPESADKAAKREKLRAFFDAQKILWPLLSQ